MRIVIAAGGTGGHLYPAIALAREFQRVVPGARILFVGTPRGLEAKVLAHEGFELRMITAKPFMGGGPLKAAMSLLALPLGIWQCVRLLRSSGTDLVIGIGGYTSPPALLAAGLLRLPRAILEPNAFPGMANRVLGSFVQRVFVAFEAAGRHFRPSTVRVVGTPLRREVYEDAGKGPGGHPLHFPEQRVPGEGQAKARDEDIGPGASRPSPLASRRTLLIFGGSQGARVINTAMIEALPHLLATPFIREHVAVIHQTGESDLARVKAAYTAAGLPAEVVPFLYDMPRALRSAALVVSRAGAVTVAELAACGKPAVLVPLPHAIYQHQEHNARVLEAAGAAVVLPQPELSGARLAETVVALLGDHDRLRGMAARSRALGRTDAASVIVRDCCALVGACDETNQSAGAARA
jgi:UDP-N-acetylglucosamine--N-acetylmuramyl-(pentapeptide) pyrophosphoryl-undecaprenol N-acetylglucosamine transferase